MSTIKIAPGNSAYASDGGCLYNAAMTRLIRVPVGQSSVNLYSGTKIIGSGAFSGCTSVTSLTLPSGLTTIESGAFSGSGIKSVTIPRGVTSIGGQSGWSPDIIYGYRGTAAESFASAGGYTFSSLGGSSSSSSSKQETEANTSGVGSTELDLGDQNDSDSNSGSADVDLGDGSANANAGQQPSSGGAAPSGNSGSTGNAGNTSRPAGSTYSATSGTSAQKPAAQSTSYSGAYSGTTSNSHTLDQTPQTADGTIDPFLFLIFGLIFIGSGLVIVGKRRSA